MAKEINREYDVNETFDFNGITLKCVLDIGHFNSCDKCFFKNNNGHCTSLFICTEEKRKDRKSVHFIEDSKEDIQENTDKDNVTSPVEELPTPNKGNDFDADKVNLVAILKDCPAGIKLYSLIHGEVTFVKVNDPYIYDHPIEVKVLPDNDNYITCYFTADGKLNGYYKDTECILFPSKTNRDWSTFDIIAIDTLVMASRDGKDWSMRYYAGTNKVFPRGKSSKDKIYANPVTTRYIIPVSEFDFNQFNII